MGVRKMVFPTRDPTWNPGPLTSTSGRPVGTPALHPQSWGTPISLPGLQQDLQGATLDSEPIFQEEQAETNHGACLLSAGRALPGAKH